MRTTILRTLGLGTYQQILCVDGKMDVNNHDNKMPLWLGLFDSTHDLQGNYVHTRTQVRPHSEGCDSNPAPNREMGSGKGKFT